MSVAELVDSPGAALGELLVDYSTDLQHFGHCSA